LSVRNAEKVALLERQFDELDTVVFGRSVAVPDEVASDSHEVSTPGCELSAR
jgi:hypothetical protein